MGAYVILPIYWEYNDSYYYNNGSYDKPDAVCLSETEANKVWLEKTKSSILNMIKGNYIDDYADHSVDLFDEILVNLYLKYSNISHQQIEDGEVSQEDLIKIFSKFTDDDWKILCDYFSDNGIDFYDIVEAQFEGIFA